MASDPFAERTLAALMAQTPNPSSGMTFQELQTLVSSLNETEAINLTRAIAHHFGWALGITTREELHGEVCDYLDIRNDENMTAEESARVQQVTNWVANSPGWEEIPEVMSSDARQEMRDLIEQVVLGTELGIPALDHVISEEEAIDDRMQAQLLSTPDIQDMLKGDPWAGAGDGGWGSDGGLRG